MTPLELIEAIPIFTALTGDEKRVLAAATSVREFRKGEVIVNQGELLPSLMMVRAGVIVMRHEEEEFGRLAPGISSARRGCSQAWAKPTRWRP